jgi:hypothetical protein
MASVTEQAVPSLFRRRWNAADKANDNGVRPECGAVREILDPMGAKH